MMHTFKTHNEGISRSSTETLKKYLKIYICKKYIKKKKKKIPGQSLKCGGEIETVKGRERKRIGEKRGDFSVVVCIMCVFCM